MCRSEKALQNNHYSEKFLRTQEKCNGGGNQQLRKRLKSKPGRVISWLEHCRWECAPMETQ